MPYFAPPKSPKHQFPNLKHIVSLLFVILNFGFVAPTHATTDPDEKTATVSATVPTITVSGDTTAPGIPLLISPSDGTVTGDNTPEFVWRRVTDDNSNHVTYTVYLNGVATFLGVEHLVSQGTSLYTARTDADYVYLMPRFDLHDGSYDWHVVASDDSGNQSSSTLWHFTVDTHAPFLQITQIGKYTNLDLRSDQPESVPEGTNYELQGPTTVTFTVHTEPWATVTLRATNTSGESTTSSWPSDGSGTVYPYLKLDEGVYTLEFSALDHAAITAALPPFTLTIFLVTLPLPHTVPLPLPEVIVLPPLPTLASLPATISPITTREGLAIDIYILLALILFVLLVIIWKRRYNILIFDARHHHPYRSLIVYHSRPQRGAKNRPCLYRLRPADRGRLYIPRLGRYSTLTLRFEDGTTLVLSLARPARRYSLSV